MVAASDPPQTAADYAELLPPEFRTFLAAPVPQSVTIRGAPGVGKTTFALGALAASPGPKLLVSTRVPLAGLRRQFGWLETAAGREIDLLEFVRFRSVPSSGALNIDHLRQTLQARASDLVDVSQVLNLPPVLQERLTSSPDPPRLIVVDSWEAWVENVLGSSAINLDQPTTRWELERTMLDELLATGASVLMVVERDERTRFDYIADGSVLLSASELEGREERWFEITKLRGIRIRSRSYPFTLEGARFRAIAPAPSWQIGPPRSEPDPNPQTPTLWPGSTAFASQFGRLGLSGPVLVETDAETPARTLWAFVAPILESALLSGGHALVRPPAIIGAQDVWATVASAAPPADLEGRLQVVVPLGSAIPPGSPLTVFSFDDGLASPEPAPSGEGRGPSPPIDLAALFPGGPTSGGHNLLLVFPSTMEDRTAEHRLDRYLALAGRARRAGVAFSSVVVTRSDDPFLHETQARAPIHVAARTRRGQVFVYGIRPWTPLMVFRPGPIDEGPAAPYELISMV